MPSVELIDNGEFSFTNNGYLETNLDQLEEKLIREDNKDIVILVVGGVGNGKSALTFWMELFLILKDTTDIVDLEEIKDEIDLEEFFKYWVYDHDGFKKAMTLSSGNIINYDEGYDSFYRRKAMTNKNTEALSIMWKYRFKNHIVFINFQNISDVEPDLLYKRCHAVIRVTHKGWFHFYSQKKINQIEVEKKSKKVSWPSPDFRGSFPDPRNYLTDIWERYEEDNAEKLEDQAEEKEDRDTDVNWLSTGDVAEKLSVDPDTIRKWHKKDKINAKRLPNGDRRIPESEIDKILNEEE